MPAPVTVIMAAYRSEWIEQSLASVVAQTYSDWELIVTDDAASPATAELVAGLDDKRVRYRSNLVPLGPALNHQQGLDQARYDLVAFINHDDLWEPTLLERLVGPLAGDSATVLAFSDHWVIGHDGAIDRESTDRYSSHYGRSALRPGAHAPFYELAIKHKAIPLAQCAVMRREAVPQLERWAAGAYDFLISVCLAKTGLQAVYIPERLARFRVHPGNLGLQRSPRADIAAARIYAQAMFVRSPSVAAYALRRSISSLMTVPKSAIRAAQAAAHR